MLRKLKQAIWTAVLFGAACTPARDQETQDTQEEAQLNRLKIESVEALQEYFRYTGKDVPLISGHRGGTYPGYPENCIETLEYVLKHTPATFEIDPRLTKDSVIVLMHDATLDRTTNGTGKLADYTLEDVKKLRLKDHQGNVTDFQIPTLDEVITWAKGKTVLILDIKDVPLAMTAAKIREHNAEAHVMVTVRNADQAKFYYEDNPRIMFEAWVRSIEALAEYEAAGIPWNQVMAYVGPEINEQTLELASKLHERGAMAMIGAGPSYDKLGPAEQAEAYRKIITSGFDVIESDYPIEVASAIKTLLPASSPKQQFFLTTSQ